MSGQVELRMRDVSKAREAYNNGDAETSRQVHDNKVHGHEAHTPAAGKYIKSMVFGGLDGIITTFAIVAAVAGGDLERNVVLLMGFANLVADGISMGLGDYISSKSELEYVKAERSREAWENENYPEGEQEEMVQLYQKRGLSEEDATQVIAILSKYPDVFLDTMMVEELGLMPPDEGDEPWKNGIVTFVSFCVFGIVPLLTYVFSQEAGNKEFFISIGLSAVTMFILGVAKAKFTGQNKLRSGFWMLVNGAIAAAAAYLIGWGFQEALGVNDCGV